MHLTCIGNTVRGSTSYQYLKNPSDWSDDKLPPIYIIRIYSTILSDCTLLLR